MDRSRALVNLVAVISLSLGAIWPNLASAAAAPAVQSLGALQEGLRVPGKLDLDAQGNLYVADARGKKILKYDASGVLRRIFDLVPVSGRGLAVSADGKRIYAEIEEKIAILDGDSGVQLGFLGGATPLTRAGDVDVDATGRVYAIDELNRKIQVFDADGNALFAFSGLGSRADGLFRRITALAVNAAANEVYVAGEGVLYATTVGKSIVQIFGLDGKFHSKIVLDSAFGGALSLCDAIAFDASGREYYLDELQANVRVRDRLSGYLTTLSIGGAGNGKVRQPAKLAFDPATSRLFVASDNAKVEIFGIDGGTNPARNHAPGVPQLLSPVAGGEVDTALPELRLRADDVDGDLLTYAVRFSGLAEVLTVTGKAGEEVVVALTAPLAENAAYTWSARASDGVDESAYSAEQTFFVNAVQEAPTVPQLTAGASGVLDGNGLLAWTACTDADPGDSVTYRVEVAADDFASPVLSTQTAAVQVVLSAFANYLDLVDGNTYLWRVTAVDNHGVTSTSATGQFVYDTAMLTVTANLPKAKVYLTGEFAYPGRFVDTVPCSFRDLAAGRYTVVVENPGCETVIEQVEVTGAGNATVAAELQLAIEPALRNAADLRSGNSRLQVTGSAAPVVVDLDADGLTDLLVGDGVAGEILFYKALDQRGAKIQYAAPRVLAKGSIVAVADWNNDDRLDLVVGGVGGEVMLYTTGNGVTWQGVPLRSTGGDIHVGVAAAPVVIDYDHDGYKDLVVGNADGQLLLYRNKQETGVETTPQLADAEEIGHFAGTVVPVVTDWDADGVRDLLVSNGGALNLLGKDSNDRYLLIASIVTVGTDSRYFVADIDGGNGKDVFVGTESGQVQLYRSAGKDYLPSVTTALLDKVVQLKELGGDPAQLDLATAAIEARDYALARRLVRALDGEGALDVAIAEFVELLGR